MTISLDTTFTIGLAACLGAAVGLQHFKKIGARAIFQHAVVGALAAGAVFAQPGLKSLVWFAPVAALLWILPALALVQWASDRWHVTQGGRVQLHQTPSLALVCVLALVCGFENWLIVALCSAAIACTIFLMARRVASGQVEFSTSRAA